MAQFGAQTRGDTLYEAISEGRRHPGMEHWLPLFHDTMDTLFDYAPGTPVVLEHLDDEAAHERIAQIADDVFLQLHAHLSAEPDQRVLDRDGQQHDQNDIAQ